MIEYLFFVYVIACCLLWVVGHILALRGFLRLPRLEKRGLPEPLFVATAQGACSVPASSAPPLGFRRRKIL